MPSTEKPARSGQERAIRRALELAPSMLAYWDRDLRCCFANKAYELWFGVDAQGLVGSSIEDLLGPTIFALNETHIRAALRGEAQSFQRIVPGPDGVQRHSLAHYLPDIVDGEVQGFVAHVTDVTTLKNTEMALRSEAVERERASDLLRKNDVALRQAQRLGQIGSWHWEVGPDITTWSDELYRILGCDPTRLPPSYAEHGRLYSARSWPVLQAAVARTLAHGDPYTLELEYVRSDGHTGWLEARGMAERDEHGAIVGLHGTAQEITARHDARDAQSNLATSQHFRDRLEALTPGVVSVFDLERQCTVYINRSVAPALGYSPEEVSAMGADVVPTLMHPEDRLRFRDHLGRMRVARDSETASFKFRMRHRAGDWRWFRSRDAVFSRNERGEVRELISTAVEIDGHKHTEQALRQEITERRRTEVALRESEAEFRAAFEQSAVGTTQMSASTRRFLRVNGKFCELTGYSAEELTGMTPADLDVAEDRDADAKVLGSMLSGETATYEVEKRYVRKNGEVIWVNVNATLLRDADGRAERTMAVIQDITARKQAEEKLRDSDQRLRLAIRAGGLAIWETNFESGHRHWSPEAMAMFGLDLADGIGRFGGADDELRSRVHPDDHHLHDHYRVELIETGSIHAEYRIVLPGGDIRWIAGGALVLTRDPAGVPVRVVHIGGDITARKQAEEKLRTNADILAQVSDAVGTIDNDERFTYVNPAFERLYRVKAADVLGRKLAYQRRWLKPGDEAVALATLRDRGEAVWELIHITRDGRELHVQCSVCRMRDAMGNVTGTLAAVRDITEQKAAEATLREREHFLQRVTDVSPSVIQVFDLIEQRSIFINRSVGSILGYSGEEIVAMGDNVVPTLMHPDDLMRLPAHLDRVRRLDGDEIADFEHRLRDRDGAWHWFHSRDAVFARDAAGAVSQLIGSAMDITERKVAEEKLRAGDERLRRVHRQSPAGIVETDATGRMTMVNMRWCEMFGYTEAELLQMTLLDITDEGSRAPTVEAMRRLAAGSPDFQIEKTYRRKDGTALAAHSSVSALHTPHGEFNGLIAVVTDVTARIQAEADLRESHQFTRRVLDNLFAFVGVMTPDGTLIEVNRAPLEAAGISSSEVLGKKFWDCHWVSHSSGVQARVRAACESAAAGEVVRYDVPGRMAGETMIWMDFQLAPLRDGEGRITHLIPSATDITERKRSEEALRQNAELFVRLVDQAPTGMYVVDADFRMQQVNALAAPVFAKVDRLIGRDFAEVMEVLWGPDVGADVARIFRHTLDTGERYVSPKFSHERHDIGGEQAYEWQTQRVALADGRHGVACYFDDVTERHRAERALRESEQRLALGTEVAGLGLGEIDYVTGIHHLTARAAQLFGLGDAAVALPRADVHATFHPEDREQLERQIAQCLDPVGLGSFAMDHRVVWPDGTVRWLTVRKQVFFAGEGSSRRAHRGSLAVRDVTHNKAAEAQLLASYTRIRLATEATGVGIWEWNVLNDTVHWNAQMFRLYGIASTPDGVVQYSVWRGAVLPADLPETERILQATVLHGGQSRRELRIERREDGEVREIEAVETVRLNEQGQAEWVLGTNLDVTERNRAKRRLQQSAAELETEVSLRTSELRELSMHLQTAREDEKASLARELHDELGGLLTAVKLDLARIRVKVAHDPAIVERLEQANNRLNEGIALKRRVIENLRPSALTNLGLASSLRILCDETSAGLGIPIDAEIEEFSADPDIDLTIYRVLQESLTNISKYASANKVRVRLCTLGETAQLEVTDDGAGFDLNQSSTGRHGITGMRFRVVSLGGTLSLDSAPGSGTKLMAAFPLQSVTERAGLDGIAD